MEKKSDTWICCQQEMKIVSKCKGVPLAAKMLGSLMRVKRNKSQWLHVKDSWAMESRQRKRQTYVGPTVVLQSFAFAS